MSYFEEATAGQDLTPYQERRIARFFREAASARIVRAESGYLISVGDVEYPLERSIFDSIETIQSLLVGCRVSDCLPAEVAIKYESEISWTIDMDSAVRGVRRTLSGTIKDFVRE